MANSRLRPIHLAFFVLSNRRTIPTVCTLAILALATQMLTGCAKEDPCDGSGPCIEVSGRVGSEHRSLVALEKAVVRLSSIGNGSTFFPKPEISIQQVRSNSDGFYSIRFLPTEEMRERGSYRLLFYKEGYGRGDLGQDITQADYENLALVPGSRNEINLHLPRSGGRLRVLITNFPGRSVANTTYTTVETGRARPGYLGIGTQPLLYATGTNQVAGSFDLTDATCETAANEFAFIQISKTKAGVRTMIRDSIYCPLNATATYTHQF